MQHDKYFHLVDSTDYLSRSSENIRDTLRVLVERGHLDPLTNAAAHEGSRKHCPRTHGSAISTALDQYTGPPDGFEYLISQDEFPVDFASRNTQTRIIFCHNQESCQAGSTMLPMLARYSQEIVRRMANSRCCHGNGIVALSEFLQFNEDDFQDCVQTQTVYNLGKLLKATKAKRPWKMLFYFLVPLESRFDDTQGLYKRPISNASLSAWLLALREGGLDLQYYLTGVLTFYERILNLRQEYPLSIDNTHMPKIAYRTSCGLRYAACPYQRHIRYSVS